MANANKIYKFVAAVTKQDYAIFIAPSYEEAEQKLMEHHKSGGALDVEVLSYSEQDFGKEFTEK